MPLALTIMAASEHELRGAVPTLDRRRIGRRHRPERLIAAKADDSRVFRAVLHQRQIRIHIPERASFGRRRPRARPYRVDQALVARRWVIARTFAWLNNSFRRLRIPYDRLAHGYEALCIIGCSLSCLNRLLR